MSRRHYFQVRIENIKDENDTELIVPGKITSNEGKGAKQIFDKNFLQLDLWYLPDTIKLYHLVEAEYTPSSSRGRWTENESETAIKISDVEAFNFVEISNKFWRLIQSIDIKYYLTKNVNSAGFKVFISKEDKDTIEAAVKNDQKPLVIKGTNFPYWFKIGSNLLHSEEKNWFVYLSNQFNILDESVLVELKDNKKKAAE